MKRVFYLLFVVIFAVSCEGPMGPPGPAGNDGADWDFETFTINQWDIDTQNGLFYAEFTVPKLTQRIYNDGVVVAYIETGSGANKIKTPLPYTIQNIDNTGYEWTEVLDFSYALRKITFFINPSDFDTSAGISLNTPTKIHVIFLY